jgi:hypothetical protein
VNKGFAIFFKTTPIWIVISKAVNYNRYLHTVISKQVVCNSLHQSCSFFLQSLYLFMQDLSIESVHMTVLFQFQLGSVKTPLLLADALPAQSSPP